MVQKNILKNVVVFRFCINFASFLKLKIVLLLIHKEMKKLVLLLAVMFSVSMFACKSSEATDAAADSAVVVEEEVVAVEDVAPADSVVADSAAVVADSAAVVAE